MTEWWLLRVEYHENTRTYSVLYDDEIMLALQKSWEDDGQYFALFRITTYPL
jgi:hypothetical protein